MELKVSDYRFSDDVARVRLNRPDRGNTWTSRMSAECRWLMAHADDDSGVRAIVVTGAGRQFCVGADFKALDHYAQTGNEYAASVSSTEMPQSGHGVRPECDRDIIWRWSLCQPIICAINGSYAAIGLALAAFSDFRNAAAGDREVTMDIQPVHTESDCKAALRQISTLMTSDPMPGTPDSDRLDILATLMQAYEKRHFPIDAPDPVEAIKFRVKENGPTMKDPEPIVGRSNRVYEVLNRKRPLTLGMIRRLHRSLGIPANVFIAETVDG